MITYKEALKEFKKGLIGGSEKEQIVKLISENSPTNRIRWLDVGMGSGDFTKKIIGELEKKGFEFEMTGVDTDKASLKRAKNNFPEADLINCKFQDFTAESKFDVIYFCQSIYYIKNKKEAIEKALDMLAEGGLIVVVMWNARDKLRQIFNQVYETKIMRDMDGESLISKVLELRGCKASWEEFIGQTDFTPWKTEESLKKVATVISRLRPEVINYLGVEDLREEIKDLKIEPRINDIILIKKDYEIKDFSREKMDEILIKKFPSYKRLVPKIMGDNEALFMASWERETEYISNQFKPNSNILELCCAAGLKSVILAKRHNVEAVDFNSDRLKDAQDNFALLTKKGKIIFTKADLTDLEQIRGLKSKRDAIIIDVDWRESLKDPIKKQNLNPFKTCPRTDKLYKDLRNVFGKEVPIIFKVSPFVRVEDMRKLDVCKIEDMYMDGKFLCYYVYYSPDVKSNIRSQVYLKSRE